MTYAPAKNASLNGIFGFLTAVFVTLALPAAAQIQLSPPTVETPAKPIELSPGAPAGQITNSAAQPPAQTAKEPAKPVPATPPNFTIVDRATGSETAPKLESWSKQLDEIEESFNAEIISYGSLDNGRDQLQALRTDVDKFLEVLKPKIEEAKAQVDTLGPVPEAGDPEAVASQRAELQQVFGSLTAAGNIAESIKLRSMQVSGKIQEIRRKKFAERLFERVPETHSLYTWQNVGGQFMFAIGKAWQTISGWWEHLDRRWDAIQLMLIAAIIAVISFYASERGVRHFRKWKKEGEPPFWQRSNSAVGVIFLRILPYAAPSAFLFFSFRYHGLMHGDVELIALAAMRSLLIVTAVCALIVTVLAPRRPHWRLLPIDNTAATRMRWLVVALAFVYSLTLLLDTIRYTSNAPFTVTVAQSLISSIVIAGLVIAILLTPRTKRPIPGDTPSFKWLSKLLWPLWAIAIIVMLTAITGYIGLARFISTQLVVTGTIISIFYLVMAWVAAVGESMADETAQVGRWLKDKAGLDQRRREQLSLPVTLLLKFGALLLVVPLILLQWGFDQKDIYEWGSSLLFGFKVGRIQISFATILASIAVFITGYIIARVFQGWLDRRVLETAGISGGARHSIKTAVGYGGIVIAALMAISYTGLDLSNVALVAGALSVGIGLGLQSVVNNFVSGLILLVERPIKVGDWVVVGDEQGLVKKISVRATEIETFERANVLIPNSYFISEKVKNWTLHNYSGRVSILIGVHYESDPRQVKDILIKVAKANPLVMNTPEPFVYFGEFGADALEFTLYAYTYDITKSLSLRTDLRIEIVEAFRAAGIEIPYRQTDINFRDDWFKEAMIRQFSQPKPLTPPRQKPRRRRRAKLQNTDQARDKIEKNGGALSAADQDGLTRRH